MAKKQRTIVGSPLTPTLLEELGGVDRFPSTPEDFRPAGNWVNTYRIWTCHGYRESGNQNVGLMRIERAAARSSEPFTLKVHQEVIQTDGMTNIIDGTIECRNNQWASPVQCTVSSRFAGADGKQIAELSSRENGRATEGEGRTTGDWCLFEAVQRLAFDRQSSLSFDLLEGMSLSKSGHRLFYRGVYSTRIGSEDMPLHCFVQLGSGILPYEYWLDARHRLLAVISMNKAYILDDRPERAIK